MISEILELMLYDKPEKETKEKRISFDAIATAFSILLTISIVSEMDRGFAIIFCIPIYYIIKSIFNFGKFCFQLLDTMVTIVVYFVIFLMIMSFFAQ